MTAREDALRIRLMDRFHCRTDLVALGYYLCGASRREQTIEVFDTDSTIYIMPTGSNYLG